MQGPLSVTTSTRQQISARRLHSWLVVVPALAALLIGLWIYRLPTRTAVPVGSLGDRLFLDSSAALDASPEMAGQWYADELGANGRSRWTRSRARLGFPSLGGGDATLTFRVQGWPADVLRSDIQQPAVTARIIQSGGSRAEIGRFEPTSEWQDYPITIPAGARTGSSLVVELETSAVFTATRQFPDVRPKGIRVDHVTLAVASPVTPLAAGWPALLLLTGSVLLMAVACRRLTASVGTATSAAGALAAASIAVLVLWRPWAAALMPLSLLPALIAGLPLLWSGLATSTRAAGQRLRMGAIPATAVLAALAGTGLLLLADAGYSGSIGPMLRDLSEPDRLLQILPLILGGLLLVFSPALLPGILRVLRRWLVAGWLAPMLLALAGGVILGWELQLLRTLPFTGHADYADNAVVARSLLRGQGWQVPYVTQFYELVPGGTVHRPQETWPLLQPVWMVPFMALLGPTALAARLPNLVFNLVLLLLVYHVGARIWDRRTGLLAALLTLFNHFFFLLTVYSTTDLGFVVLSMAAIALFFRAATTEPGGRTVLQWSLAGLITGLMGLQKPTGAIFAAGMLLWIVLRRWRGAPLPWRGLIAWAGMAGVVVLPYVIRNLVLFGQLHYSTERYDAWILGFGGTSREAWEDIYRIYLGDLPN
ncbi:MAG TPA: glycosyltransferase family 39 protein, partial [Herpetosiphonaceae bacterium]|nr:glycosyltransferase family 39 protein [Herpetosiphonaceae bacterium]